MDSLPKMTKIVGIDYYCGIDCVNISGMEIVSYAVMFKNEEGDSFIHDTGDIRTILKQPEDSRFKEVVNMLKGFYGNVNVLIEKNE